LPTILPGDIALACVPEREDPRDAFVSNLAQTLEELPPGANVGTASLRRQAQVLFTRPDLGVVVMRGHVTPLATEAGDENRLTGYPGLPVDINPYRRTYGDARLVAGSVLPAAGAYDLVLETTPKARPGPFTIRWWLNDTTPPRLRLLPMQGDDVRITATDAGSGVDPSSISASVDGRAASATWSAGTFRIHLVPGRHKLVVRVSDYQETKNMEDVLPNGQGTSVTPNTATLRATVVAP